VLLLLLPLLWLVGIMEAELMGALEAVATEVEVEAEEQHILEFKMPY
jgi:hypothetical protein